MKELSDSAIPSRASVEAAQPTRAKLPPRVGWFRRLTTDVLYVAKRDKKWWLLPLVALLLVLAALLALAATAGPLAPFIYPLL